MSVEIKLLNEADAGVLGNVAPGTFDNPIDGRSTREFLSDERHHIAVAIDGDVVVGFVSAVHYAHPDKRHPEMWINEVQVAPTHRRRGVARAMLTRMLQHARDLECAEAWVLTDRDNAPATGLYAGLGGKAGSDGGLIFSFSLEVGMEAYDPLESPDPDQWLTLDEGECILLIEEFHEREGVDLPNARVHASIHAVIENQLASGGPPQVAGTLERLLGEGLNRHDAIHALGSVLSEVMYNAMMNPAREADSTQAYIDGLKELTAEEWLSSGK